MADYSTSTPLTTDTGLVYGLVGVGNTNNPILFDPSSVGDRILTFTAPTGFSVVGSPLAGTGTISLGFSAGYSLPTTAKQTEWDTAYSWGDHASAGYLTSFTETDPIFTASPAAGITNISINNWNTAYGWGDHAAAGYLDEYEEGTFTPTVSYTTPGTLSVAYSEQLGKYTKIGDRVICDILIRLNTFTKGTASGTLVIGGLPFTAANSSVPPLASLGFYSTPFTGYPIGMVGGNSTQIGMLAATSNANWVTQSDPDSDSQYFLSVSYYTAS